LGLALILAGLALTLLGTFGWLWLCAGLFRDGWRGTLAKLALQVSGLCLVYGFVRGQPQNGLFLATFPPLALPELVKASQFLPFLTDVAGRTLPYAAVALVVCLVVRRLRPWAIGLSLATALIAAVFVGDAASQIAMCQSAARHGFTAFQRNAFDWSLANTPRDRQFEIHARADASAGAGATAPWIGMSFPRTCWVT
jgi:hypothetical protein